jgi:hypothetical protein
MKFHGFSSVELRANQNCDIVRSFSKYKVCSLGQNKKIMVALYTCEHSYEIVNNILPDLSIQQGAVLLLPQVQNNCPKMDVSRNVLVCRYIHFWTIILNRREYVFSKMKKKHVGDKIRQRNK